MLPQSQNFTYDADGNMTGDGVWTYTYDAENRLVAMETDPTVRDAITSAYAKRLEFQYDYQDRRVQKLVRTNWNGSVYSVVSYQRRYVYFGSNLVAELSGDGSSLIRSFSWGLDVAGSPSAAGGVGALVQIVDHSSGREYFPTYDSNGNVIALLNANGGSVAIAYEYSPSGELLRAGAANASGTVDSAIADNPFQFSTKFTDRETGLVYYGRRYHSPSLGRFINRDPIGEEGGLNLYGFCGNDGVNRWDYLGMEDPPITLDTVIVNERPFDFSLPSINMSFFSNSWATQSLMPRVLAPMPTSTLQNPGQARKDPGPAITGMQKGFLDYLKWLKQTDPDEWGRLMDAFAALTGEIRASNLSGNTWFGGAFDKVRHMLYVLLPNDDMGNPNEYVPDPEPSWRRDWNYLSPYEKGARSLSFGTPIASLFFWEGKAELKLYVQTALERLLAQYEGLIPVATAILIESLRSQRRKSTLGLRLDRLSTLLRSAIDVNRGRLIADKSGFGREWPDGMLGELRRLSENTAQFGGPPFCG